MVHHKPALLVCLLSLASLVRADDVEQREFSIFINGKEAGTSRIKITQKDDGTAYVVGSVDLKFRQLIADYTLKVESQEWWTKTQLVGMKTISIENGKKTELTVALDNAKQLRLRVNDKESLLKPDVWPTSYWRLVDAKYYNKQIPTLEIDTGKEVVCELKYVGTEKLKFGDLQECFHFRVMAATPIDLWFDKYHRLVRQEFTEAGHKAIVQLTKISR